MNNRSHNCNAVVHLRQTITLAVILSLVLLNWSCTPKKTETPVIAETTTEVNEKIPTITPAYQADTVFQSQLTAVFKAYLKLKDALIASDAEASRLAAASMGKTLAMVNPDLLTGAARNDWNTFAPDLGKPLRMIASAADVKESRASFSNLSESMWKTIAAFGAGGEAVYHDYCPMALENKGAFWLSAGEEIRNPYFGDAMLDCGYVKEKVN